MGELQKGGDGADLHVVTAETALAQAALSIANERTRVEYMRDVGSYLEHVHRTGEALAEGLDSWRIALRSAGASVSTVNRKLSGVKTAMRIAAENLPPEERRQVEAALLGVHRIRQLQGAIRPERMLTPAEVGKLLRRLSARGKLFVRFLYSTGCRVSEMTGIRLKDCKPNGGVDIEVVGKGDKARKVHITRKLFETILETFHGSTWLFETENGTPYRREYVSNMIERQSLRAIGRKVGAHALRHSFASVMIAKTGKVQGVSEYLGHSDPGLTLRFYTHETLTPEELATQDEEHEQP